jgi:RHS repeat-associated protein
MFSDGSNVFTWNARNQVATLNSVSLQYDGFGRRTKNLQNTSFLFDGANAVQELSGSTPTANLISGGIDEIITRADSTGAFTPLKDALGSTIALVDASGGLVTQYAYDPFGNTIVSGGAHSNAFQYTGRENEGNGLYFYRARYYSPLLGRFVNEDSIAFGGGTNFYSYVFDSPTNLTDPSGNCPVLCEPPPIVVAGGAGAGIATAVAAGEGSAPVFALVAGGSAEGAGGGPVGALIGIIGATGTYDAIQGYKLCQAYGVCPVSQAKAAPAPSLAGRYTDRDRRPGKPGNGDKDCDQQWENARAYCADLLAMPRNSPEWKKYQELWGGNYNRCVKGQVDERCGGSHVGY